MASLLVDPVNPAPGLPALEGILTLLVSISHISFSPTAEHGRFALVGIVLESVAAVARHYGADTEGGTV